MATEENPYSGQGAVVLDIGGDIGALIVEMPAHMEDLEVEIIPTGTDQRPAHDVRGHEAGHSGSAGHSHDAGHHHPHAHPHTHDAAHTHDPGGAHGSAHTHEADGAHEHPAPPHVAVVARPTPDGSTIHSLVYGELTEGAYDLYVRPYGAIRLTATVVGGEVTQLRWPDWPDSN